MHNRKLRVYVELKDGVPIRILKRVDYNSPHPIAEVSRKYAVGEIRRQVFERAAGHCERCDARITEQTGHMHEKLERGRGGEISVENSVALCPKCHLGKTGVHANHYPQFGIRREE